MTLIIHRLPIEMVDCLWVEESLESYSLGEIDKEPKLHLVKVKDFPLAGFRWYKKRIIVPVPYLDRPGQEILSAINLFLPIYQILLAEVNLVITQTASLPVQWRRLSRLIQIQTRGKVND